MNKFLIKTFYAHAAVPFLSQNYSEIIMVDLRYYKKDVSYIPYPFQGYIKRPANMLITYRNQNARICKLALIEQDR